MRFSSLSASTPFFSARRPSFTDLKGAAARGARAAELKRLKKDSEHVGGVFMLKEEWEAIKAEMEGLRAANRRLQDEHDKALLQRKPLSPLKMGGSPNFLRRATEAAEKTVKGLLAGTSTGSPNAGFRQVEVEQPPPC